ncbi:MAG: zinc carboxypeptidase [Solobacterium sp.]|nr:zinc carboxypeptidase [Solobacterium sp.]
MKTTYQYDHYYKYEELKEFVETFQKNYPDLLDVEVICETPEKRNSYALTITNKKTGKALEKPAFHMDGNTHAGEVTGSMACLHFVDVLLTNYGKEEEITKLLDLFTIYVVPRISPDGAEAYLTTPYSIRSVNRKHNAKEGGVTTEDLDGDDVVRMMRIPSKYGAWKKDPNKENSMTLRRPDDLEGDFYDIYPEGNFETYDGDENLKAKESDWQLDFNRNFPYGWFPENRQYGAGKYPLSNPETKALADWIIAHPNIGMVSTNHTSGGIFLYPPGTKASSKSPSFDMKMYKEIGKLCKEELGYDIVNIFDAFISDQEAVDSGAFDDWCYETQGLIAFTIELWDLAKRVNVPYEWGKKDEDEQATELKRFNACLDWVKENAPEAFVPWQPYKHPIFKDVEIGGFNFKFTHQNPPTHLLLSVLDQMTSFALRCVKTLPRLVIDDVEIKEIEKEIYDVSVTIGNLGYLPTNITEVAKDLEINKPIVTKITGCEVLSGKQKEEKDFLEGYSNTSTGAYFYGNLSTDENAKARKKYHWIVRAKNKEDIHIEVTHPKAGKVSI